MWKLIEDIKPPKNVRILVFGNYESPIGRIAYLIEDGDGASLFKILVDGSIRYYELSEFLVWTLPSCPSRFIGSNKIEPEQDYLMWDQEENVARTVKLVDYTDSQHDKVRNFLVQGLCVMSYENVMKKFTYVYDYPRI